MHLMHLIRSGSSLLLAKKWQNILKNLWFRPISTIFGRKVDIVGHYFCNLYVAMEIVTNTVATVDNIHKYTWISFKYTVDVPKFV